MNEWTLSEVCYKNGFRDGQESDIYIVTNPYGDIYSASHDLDSIITEIDNLTEFKTIILSIYSIKPDIWGMGEFVVSYDWNFKTKRYEKTSELKN